VDVRHAITFSDREATTNTLTLTGQPFDAKEVEAETFSVIVQWFSCEAYKHIIFLPVHYGFEIVDLLVACCSSSLCQAESSHTYSRLLS
jgi:hypothetical protein